MLIGYLLGFSSAFLLSTLIGGLWVLSMRDEDLLILVDKELVLENKDPVDAQTVSSQVSQTAIESNAPEKSIQV